MSVENAEMLAENKEAVRRWIAAVSSNDIDRLFAAMTPDFHYEIMGDTQLSGVIGKEELKQSAAFLYEHLKDGIQFEIVTMTAEDDRVAAEFRGRGQLVSGDWYNNEYHGFFRVRDGKVSVYKEYFDTALVQQVLVPMLEQGDTA